VKDVALHLLDDDFGWLSPGRDGDLEGRIRMDVDYRDFVVALNQKNQCWVDASRGLSRQLVLELLAWSGHRVAGRVPRSSSSDFDFLIGGTKIEKYLRAALRCLTKHSNRLISGNVVRFNLSMHSSSCRRPRSRRWISGPS
jgi:hypothetical protein